MPTVTVQTPFMMSKYIERELEITTLTVRTYTLYAPRTIAIVFTSLNCLNELFHYFLITAQTVTPLQVPLYT